MMKKRNVMILFSATVALTLAACGSKEQSSSTSSNASKTKYASEVTHDGTPIKGGTLKYAIVSSSPFSGIFADELSADTNDSTIGGLVDESMFEYKFKNPKVQKYKDEIKEEILRSVIYV